ncbi:putative histidine kinase [Streptococcus pneumoniae]|uniref:Histidine kinase n=9 Tax=Streptococcus pneumoniae TaxID=1313 RepID=A0AA95II13_STREE|nr:ATP-binding protein [Streptococcus pneumoniae]MDG9631160.1 ATP-binding protein [Streptococcus pneumoniae]MDS2296729.1 ATP-binding protein [Streptococcus pneumoniae]MDS2573827.1 ATP-binding protein [Streptococcus pneumoniae]MDS2654171.1 ATP-binding protein [Streptococcus pneumoniae]MDS2764936.1 ATP-binding protein [Streptococcus pneumoniae]
MEEKLHFKVSSGLKDIIGKDLITNELVAIFELAKNGYDADATEINLIINSYENYIIIQDNGKGMNRNDIENKWLFVAHSEKKDSDKVYAGSKGIGRFSCDRLGTKLKLISHKDDEVSKLEIDWGEFEKDSLIKFEELDVTYTSLDVVEDSFIQKSGTMLNISNLRDTWDLNRVDKVIEALQRLVNPFVDDGKIKINVKYISSSSGIAELDEYIRNDIASVLDKKTIYIECYIKEKEISISLYDKEKIIYSFKIENNTILKDIYFKIFYMGFAAKYNFTKIMKMRPKDYGSIFLYKNNFRIFPYGEVDFDAFGLNLRKAQGYNRYLGHRELLGWINITDSENHFNEVTSRDRGFVTNSYTMELEKVYLELVHRPLESYVQLINFGNSDIDEIETDDTEAIQKLIRRFKKYKFTVNPIVYELPKIAQPLEKKFELLDDVNTSSSEKKEIQKNLKQAAVELRKENQEVKKEKQKIDKENSRLKNEIEIKEKIILNKKPARQDMLFHELGKAGKELTATLQKMIRLMTPEEYEKFSDSIYKIRRTSDKLSSIKKQILRLNFESFSNLENIELKSYLKSYVDNLIDDTVKLNVSLGIGELYQSINVYDFGTLLDNLIINAQDRNAKDIHIFFDEDNKIMHFTSDTGPIDIEPIENIFNIGVTSKRRGTGLGMYICQQICKDFNWEISVQQLKNNVVDFQIKFSEV